MLASFVTLPSMWGRTLTSTLALPPLATVPSEQVTVPADSEQLPCEDVAESKSALLGRLSTTVTPAALCGPALETASVYVSCSPASTGSGESAFVRPRSDTGLTVVVALAELSAESGSVAVETTAASFVIDPGAPVSTLITTVTLAPLAIVPSAQVTVLPTRTQLPCVA